MPEQELKVKVALQEHKLTVIEKKIDKISSNLSKIGWVVITAVLGAVVKYVINGGVIKL